jgi:glutaredoxin
LTVGSLLPRALVAFAALTGASACLASSQWSPEKIDAVAGACHEKPFEPRPGSQPEGIAVPMRSRPAGTPVVVYGASWCQACAIAAAYLTRRRIPFVERDVEQDAAAAAARLATLVGAGLQPRKTLPVVDVRGTVTLGFYPCVVEEAWAAR